MSDYFTHVPRRVAVAGADANGGLETGGFDTKVRRQNMDRDDPFHGHSGADGQPRDLVDEVTA